MKRRSLPADRSRHNPLDPAGMVLRLVGNGRAELLTDPAVTLTDGDQLRVDGALIEVMGGGAFAGHERVWQCRVVAQLQKGVAP